MTVLQEIELNILKEVINLLDRNGLHYCAIGGTCLGAIRHNGFIPWDDDIDICMPRKDYEVFRTEVYKQLPEHLKKMDYDVSFSHNFVFFKVYDETTTLIEKNAMYSPDRITGVFVDIFPLDGVPNGTLSKKLWFLRYYMLRKMNDLVRFNDPPESIKQKIKKPFAKALLKVFRYNYFTDRFLKLASRYSAENCKVVHYNGYRPKDTLKHTHVRDYFYNQIEVPFETIKIKIPREYDRYLTEKYGDYMQLPPEDERGKWHNVVVSDMEKPCAYYKQKIAEYMKDNGMGYLVRM